MTHVVVVYGFMVRFDPYRRRSKVKLNLQFLNFFFILTIIYVTYIRTWYTYVLNAYIVENGKKKKSPHIINTRLT
jgi:hypothetical protein